ncbi:hypothetical protein [Aquabacterium sp. OR-4]|uniref:hypothetical protein n=1 Tax=Aquabacterium sp. OR-4 TaxID=2978127 RepID=UPI0021B3B5D2|nr:hypothetical protein [Aquabacterium sp. OR-4]MDT7835645.1 hypothetical protein [Aquabacterium sp. OR-4]
MIPVPEVTEYPPLPADWLVGGVVPALVPGACLSRSLLADFARQARAAGLAAGPQRMRYDRRYALQILAAAHALGDEALRAVALRLFEQYQGWATH